MLRCSKAGFAVMFITGVLLFMTHAGKAYGNVFFRAKLMFLLLLGINALVYQTIFYPQMAVGCGAQNACRREAVAGLSLIVWIGVIICGRTMAYRSRLSFALAVFARSPAMFRPE